MVSPFEIVITRLDDIGAFQFLFPFMIAAALFYGLLRKSRIFGDPQENVAVNAVLALVAAFMVSAYPILVGVNVKQQFATFFFNAVVAILTVASGLMIAGMFFEGDLSKQISTKLGRLLGPILILGLLVGGGIVVASGFISVFIPQNLFSGPSAIPPDVLLTIAVLAVMGVILAVVVVPFGRGEKKT